jgi:hypothetical protein
MPINDASSIGTYIYRAIGARNTIHQNPEQPALKRIVRESSIPSGNRKKKERCEEHVHRSWYERALSQCIIRTAYILGYFGVDSSQGLREGCKGSGTIAKRCADAGENHEVTLLVVAGL